MPISTCFPSHFRPAPAGVATHGESGLDFKFPTFAGLSELHLRGAHFCGRCPEGNHCIQRQLFPVWDCVCLSSFQFESFLRFRHSLNRREDLLSILEAPLRFVEVRLAAMADMQLIRFFNPRGFGQLLFSGFQRTGDCGHTGVAGFRLRLVGGLRLFGESV